MFRARRPTLSLGRVTRHGGRLGGRRRRDLGGGRRGWGRVSDGRPGVVCALDRVRVGQGQGSRRRRLVESGLACRILSNHISLSNRL